MKLLKKIFSFPALTLLVALSLSAIAAWYSILGLTAIFAAAVIPIIIMGGVLEVAKVVTTVWLHRYWNRTGWQLKLYLIPAVLALALLTSMGIFGFLSKAHIDQGVPTGDVAAQVALIEEKISNERQNIDSARSLLKQLDDAVIGITASKDNEIRRRDGTIYSQSGAERAVQVRRSQAKDRAEITKQIEEAQARIVKLQEEKAPIASQLRKVEAEVGPIKYVASLIYGDNPDANLLERAVRWMIVLIVVVFDPLALVLVIAAQKSFRWMEEDEEQKKNDKIVPLSPVEEPAVEEKITEPSDGKIDRCWMCGTPLIVATGIGPFCPNKECYVADDSPLVLEEEPVVIKTVEPVVEPVEEPIIDSVKEEIEEPIVVEPVKPIEKVKNVEVKTDGVTFNETDGGYVQFDGKSVQKDALKELHPELFTISADTSMQVNTNFGTNFPKIARKGDVFVRVDMLPNRVYKFDSHKWIEINKSQSDSYLYDEAYIRYLVNKLEKGEYDIELLSDNERQQIEEYLRK
jgi:hypothetical protein